ncbi:hypothetical protein MLD38_008333 [Melastoma candidum]|uniref:Uncharacterized protein n=1 Tax=Melastoma candidum TaxID=119954 RepID=A0ACB9RTY4_9MYRT|nr:hypothetical protein MLD38_008333 [Melastoma candidum]
MSVRCLLPPCLPSFGPVIRLLLVATALRFAGSVSTVLAVEDVPSELSNSTTPSLTFFMHDILGGSAPSGRMVVGTVPSIGVTNLPFSKPIRGLFPPNRGIPLNGVINGQTVPFLAGAGGNRNVVTGRNSFPFVTAGQLPTGATLRGLVFGTITVIDDEITGGRELGSSVMGKAQGFHLASSRDGSSRTMAFTVMFGDGGGEEDKEEDSISLFGVHRTAAPVSLIAIVGGTGKYAEASGYAEIETLHGLDEHLTDGIETLLQINVHFT